MRRLVGRLNFARGFALVLRLRGFVIRRDARRFRRTLDVARRRLRFAEIGKDPVCAGASVLAMAAAQCIDWMGGHDCMEEPPKIHVAGGNVRVVIKPKPENFNDALLIIGTVAVGYQLLQEAYPGYVKYYQFDTADIPAESIQTGS